MLKYYKLNPDHSIAECTPAEALKLRDSGNTQVMLETYKGITFSTALIFHNILGDHARGKWFETAVYRTVDGPDHAMMKHYATWDEAVAGHQQTVALARTRIDTMIREAEAKKGA